MEFRVFVFDNRRLGKLRSWDLEVEKDCARTRLSIQQIYWEVIGNDVFTSRLYHFVLTNDLVVPEN